MDNITSYLGYSDNIKEPAKTRIEMILNKKCRYESKIYNSRSFLLTLLLDGAVPKIEENVITYNSRTGEPNKPKTEYRLYNVSGEFWEINKTEYGFCVYCIENGFTGIECINKYIENENRKLEIQKKEKEEKERLLREKEKIENEEIQRIKKEITSLALTLPESEKKLADDIFTDIYGETGFGYQYIFIALIHNIDNPICKDKLMQWLKSNEKIASMKIFEHITGVKLPKSQKKRLEFLERFSSSDIIGFKEYNPRKKPKKS